MDQFLVVYLEDFLDYVHGLVLRAVTALCWLVLLGAGLTVWRFGFRFIGGGLLCLMIHLLFLLDAFIGIRG